MRVYKYMPSRYLDEFVDGGRVLFRNLTFYRQLEKTEQGDLYEGRHVDRPGGGVKITSSSGNSVEGDFAFVNAIRAEEVFVCCFSTTLDDGLYAAFAADACVEIAPAERFVDHCRRAMRKDADLKGWTLVAGPVEYYEQNQAAKRSIKQPRNLAFFKPARYSHQAEFRVALISPLGMELQQRIMSGHAVEQLEDARDEVPRKIWLTLRQARRYLTVHRTP